MTTTCMDLAVKSVVCMLQGNSSSDGCDPDQDPVLCVTDVGEPLTEGLSLNKRSIKLTLSETSLPKDSTAVAHEVGFFHTV